MITDNGLRLADAVAVPTAGGIPDLSSATTAPVFIDLASGSPNVKNLVDPSAWNRTQLAVHVTTAFAVTADLTVELRAITIPISAVATLDDATGSGEALTFTVPGVVASDNFTLNGHSLPFGTPVQLLSLGTVTVGSGAVNDVYYVVPTTPNAFQLATSLDNAIAGTTITLGGTNANVQFGIIPTVHGSTGALECFNSPAEISPFQAGAKFVIPFVPLPDTPKALMVGETTGGQTGLSEQWTIGAGPDNLSVGRVPQRYLCMEVRVDGSTLTGGAISADIVVDGGNEKVYPASGVEVVG